MYCSLRIFFKLFHGGILEKYCNYGTVSDLAAGGPRNIKNRQLASIVHEKSLLSIEKANCNRFVQGYASQQINIHVTTTFVVVFLISPPPFLIVEASVFPAELQVLLFELLACWRCKPYCRRHHCFGECLKHYIIKLIFYSLPNYLGEKRHLILRPLLHNFTEVSLRVEGP